MSMNQIPTLVLGIGGIGCKIAAAISDSLNEEDRKYVSVIGIDTNVNDLSELRGKHEMEIIQTSDDRNVNDYLEKHSEYLEWFPDNDFLRERTMTDGAGQVRTLSRLAFLASVESGRFDPILREITRIRRVDDNPHNKNLTIIVVGSITGGTGAGLFLNIPFYLRDLIKSQVGIQKCIIRGMFVGPDIVEDVQPSKTNKDAVCVNGYTCLKELNAFYMRPVIGRSIANNLRLEFYDHEDTSTNNIPYDYLYLVEKSGNSGAMGDVRLEEVINYIAHIAFVLMFSPVTADALSTEDNFVLDHIANAGMNRYAGAGMCKLVYPIKTAQEYVTLSVVSELVKGEWMHVDQRFAAQTKTALSRMVSDSTVQKPVLKKAYVEMFKEDAIGDHAKLGKFAQEAFIEKGNEYVSLAGGFIAALDKKIEDLLNNDEVKEKANNCKVDEQRMRNFSDAAAQINNVWEEMRNYAKYAKHLIATKPVSFADDLFPTSQEVMNFRKDNPECIYQYLAKVHPVTARFFIFDIINRLEVKIAKSKEEITGLDLSAYTKEDFDPKKDDIQGPAEYLSSIRDKYNPIWKMLGPLGQAINGEERALRSLRKRLVEVCDGHISTTQDYIKNSLEYEVSKLVLERMNVLADNYTIFFNTVAEKIDRNNENITRLENIHFPFGQEGIYCSKDAFKKMTTDFLENQLQDLSYETKAAIFEQIYFVQARSYALNGAAETKEAKERRMQENKKRLEAVFNTAVVETIRSNVIKHGGGIVNFTAREALIKEFELNEQKYSGDPDYAEEIKKYAKERIDTALRVAKPMITTGGGHENAELTFIALSPDCAETDSELRPDTIETAKFYLPNNYASATVIINPEFDDTELTCMRLSYNFAIENLTKYKAGTRNAKAYDERIANLAIKRVFNYNSDEMFVTVNPHLNSHWHQEGFIPSMQGTQRQKDHEEHLKAFIYAMGFDSFRLIADDDNPDTDGKPRLTWYSYVDGFTQFQPVRKCEKLIGTGYSDLFDALLYNRTIKLAILRYAQKTISNMKGYNTADELFDDILENRFIVDLIQPIGSRDEDDINLFDAFLKMRPSMPLDDWNSLFEGLLFTLWEFCEILFDKSEVYINKAVKSILTGIFENSVVGTKAESEYSKSEILLKVQYENILARRYERQ